MIAVLPGCSSRLSDGTPVSSRYSPPSISGRYRKNTNARVRTQNQTRRSLPQFAGPTRA